MITSIRDIIAKDIILNVEHRKVEIKENDNNSKQKSLKKVIIEGLPENIIAFKLDAYVTMSNNYNPTNRKGINKGVDAVIITEEYILFIELKLTKIHKPSIVEKVYASVSFSQALSSLLEYFYGNSLKNLKVGIIVMALTKNNTRLHKPSMRPKKSLNFQMKHYPTNSSKIKVLEIKKDRAKNQKFSLQWNDIIEHLSRNKNFRKWP